MKQFSLTGNQLKLIALITMTVDHAGVILFPKVQALRIIGRLAFPIYAFLIAEGCRHTRSMGRYFGTMAIFAAALQLFYFFYMGSLYQSVLVTFSMSIGLILLLRQDKLPPPAHGLLVCGGFLTVLFLCEGLPYLLPGTDYYVDYGAIGVMLPVLAWMVDQQDLRLPVYALGLGLLSAACGGIQWWCLGAVPLLALYNGQRGKENFKYLFYIYYPLHLVVLYLIGFIL